MKTILLRPRERKILLGIGFLVIAISLIKFYAHQG